MVAQLPNASLAGLCLIFRNSQPSETAQPFQKPIIVARLQLESSLRMRMEVVVRNNNKNSHATMYNVQCTMYNRSTAGVTNDVSSLEAFSVDDGWARLVVFLLGDPQLLEGGERSQDGSSDPDGVFPLGRSNDLDLHGGGSKGGDLLLHPVTNTGEHGGTSGKDGVGVQILPDVNIALHDGVVGVIVDSGDLHTDEGRLEHSLRAPEPLVSDGDDLSVGKLIGLLEGAGAGSGLHLLLEVKGDVAQLLLDIPDDFPFGGGGERVATLGEDLGEVVGQISASQIQTHDGVGEGITFIDGDSMGNTISRIQDDTGGPTRSVQGEDSLDSNVHGGGVEGLEHDLSHLFSVGL